MKYQRRLETSLSAVPGSASMMHPNIIPGYRLWPPVCYPQQVEPKLDRDLRYISIIEYVHRDFSLQAKLTFLHLGGDAVLSPCRPDSSRAGFCQRSPLRVGTTLCNLVRST